MSAIAPLMRTSRSTTTPKAKTVGTFSRALLYVRRRGERKTSRRFLALTHVGDHEAAPGGLVLRLPRHDGAVDVVGVCSSREDEEERGQAEEDVEQGRNRALHALFGGAEWEWQ